MLEKIYNNIVNKFIEEKEKREEKKNEVDDLIVKIIKSLDKDQLKKIAQEKKTNPFSKIFLIHFPKIYIKFFSSGKQLYLEISKKIEEKESHKKDIHEIQKAKEIERDLFREKKQEALLKRNEIKEVLKRNVSFANEEKFDPIFDHIFPFHEHSFTVLVDEKEKKIIELDETDVQKIQERLVIQYKADQILEPFYLFPAFLYEMNTLLKENFSDFFSSATIKNFQEEKGHFFHFYTGKRKEAFEKNLFLERTEIKKELKELEEELGNHRKLMKNLNDQDQTGEVGKALKREKEAISQAMKRMEKKEEIWTTKVSLVKILIQEQNECILSLSKNEVPHIANVDRFKQVLTLSLLSKKQKKMILHEIKNMRQEAEKILEQEIALKNEEEEILRKRFIYAQLFEDQVIVSQIFRMLTGTKNEFLEILEEMKEEMNETFIQLFIEPTKEIKKQASFSFDDQNLFDLFFYLFAKETELDFTKEKLQGKKEKIVSKGDFLIKEIDFSSQVRQEQVNETISRLDVPELIRKKLLVITQNERLYEDLLSHFQDSYILREKSIHIQIKDLEKHHAAYAQNGFFSLYLKRSHEPFLQLTTISASKKDFDGFFLKFKFHEKEMKKIFFELIKEENLEKWGISLPEKQEEKKKIQEQILALFPFLFPTQFVIQGTKEEVRDLFLKIFG